MKTNYYAVREKNSELIPSTLVSFKDKDKAEEHARLLNDSGGNYIVIPSEVTLFNRISDPCPYSQP